ncbi:MULTISPECIES: hypothetical protein [unclassified Aureimonas]|uniref:hypothetical protein n=1 Tax=unclassified Aureimonas TaxID=2615206 RepID=UPI0006FDDF2A|nr:MULTISPECIES: hypothetical protein [unclassified Aureimonas]KQT52417.1 hypothetical protein ASG62_14410 [Aureimonas sp. Leaf427]KQT74934.1 hypothetical protein ASG54_16255 [Aureimonas sp. Leaf460]
MKDGAVKLNLNLPPAADDRAHMRRSIRRLSDFSKTVEFALRQFNTRYGLHLELAPRHLTRAFLEWARAFDEQRELADRDRRDFSHFAAGLMLRSLIRNPSVTPSAERPGPAGSRHEEDALVEFWPEGVFYFEFCITVLDRVLEEQSLEAIELSPQAINLRSWQSFRENVAENPDLAIPFLDLFLGGDPVWDFPTAARFRSALKKQLLPEGLPRPATARPLRPN